MYAEGFDGSLDPAESSCPIMRCCLNICLKLCGGFTLHQIVCHHAHTGPDHRQPNGHGAADRSHLLQHDGGLLRIGHCRKEWEPWHHLSMPNVLEAQQCAAAPKEIGQPFEFSAHGDLFGSLLFFCCFGDDGRYHRFSCGNQKTSPCDSSYVIWLLLL